jgi:hypothetical protein
VRTIVSDSGTPDTVNAFSFPEGVVLDSANNRPLVVVDLVNGQRVFVSR